MCFFYTKLHEKRERLIKLTINDKLVHNWCGNRGKIIAERTARVSDSEARAQISTFCLIVDRCVKMVCVCVLIFSRNKKHIWIFFDWCTK